MEKWISVYKEAMIPVITLAFVVVGDIGGTAMSVELSPMEKAIRGLKGLRKAFRELADIRYRGTELSLQDFDDDIGDIQLDVGMGHDRVIMLGKTLLCYILAARLGGI